MIVIEKDKAVEAIPEVDADVFENCGRCELLSKEDVVEIINRLPTIEIVRCRECRRWNTIPDPMAEYGMCERWGRLIVTRGAYFCADGKRRDEDE